MHFRKTYRKYKQYKIIKTDDQDDEKGEPIKKNINVGVEILRVIYCFLVVIVHFGSGDIYKFSWKYIDFYVTSFFLIAFYFSYNTFSSRYIPKVKERFWRLLYPYILWPIIVYIRQNFYTLKQGHFLGLFNKALAKRFYIQFLLGNNIHGIMWFLFNLLFSSLFVCIIVFMFKSYHLYPLFVFFILNSIYNYYKLHGYFMASFPRSPIQHSFEIMNETFIFAISGYTLGYFNILKLLKNLTKYIFIFFSPIFYIVRFHQEVFDKFPGFNVIFNTLFISGLFIFFGTLPFDIINNRIVNKIFQILTRHTGGIYYIHTEAYDILINKYHLMYPRSTKSCVLVYVVSYIFCDIGTRIFKRWRLRYIFN